MRRFVFGFVFLCCAFCYQARAVVPLEIKATLQLPEPANPWEVIPWDVQHCDDGTSFGYAYVVGDTIYYALRGFEQLRVYQIPPLETVCFGAGDFRHLSIKLFKIASRGDHLCILLQSNYSCWDMPMDPPTWSEYVIRLIDLDSQSLFYTTSFFAGNSWSGHGTGSTTSSISNIIAWPPLPNISSVIVYSQSFHSSGERMGGRVFFYNVWNSLHRINLIGSVTYSQFDSGLGIHPFADFGAALFVINDVGFRSDCTDGGMDPDTCEGERWSSLSQYNSLTNQRVGLSNCHLSLDQHCAAIVQIPQHDLNGTNRLISPGAYAVSATQVSDTLWHNAALVGTLYTAKLIGEGDEQVLGYDPTNCKFGVFNGGTGALMDCTSAIQGAIAYLIKQPNRFDEIVTKDATNLVRVYGTTPNPPSALLNVVCKYLPADSSIQVCWSPVFRASSYYIFSRPFCSEDFEAYLGEVADTTFTIPISNSRECFRVSAVGQ